MKTCDTGRKSHGWIWWLQLHKIIIILLITRSMLRNLPLWLVTHLLIL